MEQVLLAWYAYKLPGAVCLDQAHGSSRITGTDKLDKFHRIIPTSTWLGGNPQILLLLVTLKPPSSELILVEF